MKISDFELEMFLTKGFKILFLSFTMLMFFGFVTLLLDKISNPTRMPLNYGVYCLMGLFLIVLLFIAFKYIIKIVRK